MMMMMMMMMLTTTMMMRMTARRANILRCLLLLFWSFALGLDPKGAFARGLRSGSTQRVRSPFLQHGPRPRGCVLLSCTLKLNT